MLTALIGMGAAGLLLAALSAPRPESYLLGASALILVSLVGFGALFFVWVFPQLVTRLNRYEGREDRTPVELISEAFGRSRPVSRPE
jgi:hypothetical protein